MKKKRSENRYCVKKIHEKRGPVVIMAVPSMECEKQFCKLMYAGHRENQRKMEMLEAERNMYRENYTRMFSEYTTVGNGNRSGQHVLPTGEVMKAETYLERTKMFNENKQTLERRVKELDEVKRLLEQSKESLRVKMMRVRELEEKLNGFDRPREYVFGDERHKQTAAENTVLKEKNEALEADNRTMKETIKTLQAEVERASRATVLIPKRCPYGGCSKDSYVRGVLISKDAGQALKNHIYNYHWCSHCRTYLNGTTTAKHVETCEKNAQRIRVPKRPLATFQQDDLENATAEERAGIEAEAASGGFANPTFAIPTTADGKVDLAAKYDGLHCRFCYKGPHDSKHERAEHEDMCADVKVYRRFRCPCFGYSDREEFNVCYYWSIDERRAYSHARRDNRRRVCDGASDPMLCPSRAKGLPLGMKWDDVKVVERK
jgi:hypothetical protein